MSETTVRLRADREQAERALELANEVGKHEAARRLGVTPRTLYRAWDHHNLGRPTTRASARQSRVSRQSRPARQRVRTRGEVDGRERD